VDGLQPTWDVVFLPYPYFILIVLISSLDGSTVCVEEKPPFAIIDCKTWKLDLFMPKVNPKIRVINGPEAMYLENEGGRERERKRKRKRR
jgi:hypothetical protein